MPEEMNAYEADVARGAHRCERRIERALGLAKGGALRVRLGGIRVGWRFWTTPATGAALGARPKPRKGGKTSAASKRAREPAAPARASRRLRGIDVSGQPSATPVRAVSYAEQASDTTQHKRRRARLTRFFRDPGSEIAARFSAVRSASPCTRSGTCTAARSRAGTGPVHELPVPPRVPVAWCGRRLYEFRRAVADSRVGTGEGRRGVPGHEALAPRARTGVKASPRRRVRDRGVRDGRATNAHRGPRVPANGARAVPRVPAATTSVSRHCRGRSIARNGTMRARGDALSPSCARASTTLGDTRRSRWREPRGCARASRARRPREFVRHDFRTRALRRRAARARVCRRSAQTGRARLTNPRRAGYRHGARAALLATVVLRRVADRRGSRRSVRRGRASARTREAFRDFTRRWIFLSIKDCSQHSASMTRPSRSA